MTAVPAPRRPGWLTGWASRRWSCRPTGCGRQTRTGHLRQIMTYAGWRMLDAPGWKELDEFLFARAMEHDSPKLLFRLACEYLRSEQVVRPGVVSLLEHVAAARERARGETWMLLAPLVRQDGRGVRRRGRAGRAAVADPDLGCTPLRWLETRGDHLQSGGGEDRAGQAGLPASAGCAHAGSVDAAAPSGGGSWPGCGAADRARPVATGAGAALPDLARPAGGVGGRRCSTRWCSCSIQAIYGRESAARTATAHVNARESA